MSAIRLVFGWALGVIVAGAIYSLFGPLVAICYLSLCIASLQWSVNEDRRARR